MWLAELKSQLKVALYRTHTIIEHCTILDGQSRHSIPVQTTLTFIVVLEPERLSFRYRLQQSCGGDGPIYTPASASSTHPPVQGCAPLVIETCRG